MIYFYHEDGLWNIDAYDGLDQYSLTIVDTYEELLDYWLGDSE